MAITERERLKLFSGDKLLLLIKKRKMQYRLEGIKKTQKEIIKNLSGIINVSSDTILNWLKGKNQPGDYFIVEALAREFNVEPEYFEDENLLKDTVISMNENNVIVECKDKDLNETSIEQVKLMSGVINDMLDSMKKLQEISGANKNEMISVYHNVSEFLETYRSLDYGSGISVLSEKFNVMYRNFRKLRLEMPRSVYDKLEEYMTEYLFWIIGIDKALQPYMKDLDSRIDDDIDFIMNITFNNSSRVGITKMKPDCWSEYSNLTSIILANNTPNVEYKELVNKLQCNYQFDEEGASTADYYEMGALFVLDLYAWIFEVWDKSGELYDWLIASMNRYKTTLINDAYRHLDEILSEYIPQ